MATWMKGKLLLQNAPPSWFVCRNMVAHNGILRKLKSVIVDPSGGRTVGSSGGGTVGRSGGGRTVGSSGGRTVGSSGGRTVRSSGSGAVRSSSSRSGGTVTSSSSDGTVTSSSSDSGAVGSSSSSSAGTFLSNGVFSSTTSTSSSSSSSSSSSRATSTSSAAVVETASSSRQHSNSSSSSSSGGNSLSSGVFSSTTSSSSSSSSSSGGNSLSSGIFSSTSSSSSSTKTEATPPKLKASCRGKRRRPEVFDREFDWESEKQCYVRSVTRHIKENPGVQDVMSELFTLMNHVTEQTPGANDSQWRHPSDLTRRNYQRHFGNTEAKMSLADWQESNMKAHARFSNSPRP
ncbi:S100P-binding protein [Solea senegalensis]|uniref:S100P-binding protein n=1 Tax=Solea senegalensis TaxID=28829 RepID=A0AAV6PHE0_SOLSE|nr:S100P-binding protein [Solea senegalensis]